MRFTKMQGIGNDFVMVDRLRPEDVEGLTSDLPHLARVTCDRKFGIGGDGLILVEAGDRAPFRMRMFNPDGSESEMCGNGIRCFGRLLFDHGHLDAVGADAGSIEVETGAGILAFDLQSDRRIRVDMGLARIKAGEIGMTREAEGTFVGQPVGDGYTGTAISMGNPHLVIFVDDVAAIDLATLGPRFEAHPFFPNRTNVHFVQVEDRSHLVQRTWERGAGITFACGTGACASAVAGFLTGRSDRQVQVRLPGGALDIDFQESARVFMTGPAETVFEGEY